MYQNSPVFKAASSSKNLICFGSGGISVAAGTAIIIYTVATDIAIADTAAAGCTKQRNLRGCCRLGWSLRTSPSAGSTLGAERESSFSSPSFSCGCPSIACYGTHG